MSIVTFCAITKFSARKKNSFVPVMGGGDRPHRPSPGSATAAYIEFIQHSVTKFGQITEYELTAYSITVKGNRKALYNFQYRTSCYSESNFEILQQDRSQFLLMTALVIKKTTKDFLNMALGARSNLQLGEFPFQHFLTMKHMN